VVSQPAGPADGSPFCVIGIGASAGGVDALTKVFSQLRAEMSGAILVVLHLAPASRSLLPSILDRLTPLSVRTAEDGEPIEWGQVYVAPPDHHLLVQDGRIALTRGPKENGVRPAVDTMFRSLAATFGSKAVAVVLSGALGDGSNGALAVARAGGMVIVQDPEEAVVPSMPERALAAVGDVDHVLPASAIGELLANMTETPVKMLEDRAMVAPQDPIEESRHRPEGPATGYTCPECSGALWELREGEIVRYRCRVGHSYSEDAILVEQGSAVEAALWAALEVLEERAELLRRIADRRPDVHAGLYQRLKTGAQDALDRADLIRRALAVGGDGPLTLTEDGEVVER
jgi:two-component system, chemotaxis family, protein-glutamate methylesterase/glutaminase